MSALREARLAAGLSQEKLAELAGTSQPQINKLEKGQRKLTLDWAVKFARVLDVDPNALLTEKTFNQGPDRGGDGIVMAPDGRVQLVQAKHYGQRRPADATATQMPVRAAARGGVEQEMFLEDGPIDWITKPAYLMNARDPYAMYVVGDSMMPRFRPAQLLHVNPHKPPAPGSGVVVVKTNKAVLIKEFVRHTREGGVVLREYQPEEREFTVPRAEIDTVNTVVGLQEP